MSTPPVEVITLGTAGGPRVWLTDDEELRCDITTAVVGEKWYLFDCGQSVYRRCARLG